MQVNSLCGLLTEYGEVMARSRAALDNAIAGGLERLSERLPAVLIDTLREQVEWIRKSGYADRGNRATPAGMDEPGQGMQGDSRNSRHWAADGNSCRCDDGRPDVVQVGARVCRVAWPGSWANRFRWQGAAIGYKQKGDTYVRTLLIHGARSVVDLHHRGPFSSAKVGDPALQRPSARST
jgi:transposase